MQVMVCSISGLKLDVLASPTAPVVVLKQQVEEAWQIPASYQVLLCGTLPLEDHAEVGEAVAPGTHTLTMVVCLDRLRQSLHAECPRVRYEAVRSTQRMAHRMGHVAIDLLGSCVGDQDDRVRCRAAEALLTISDADPLSIEVIGRRLQHEETNVRFVTIGILKQLISKGNMSSRAAALAMIVAGLEDKTAVVRKATIKALESSAKHDPSIIHAVAARLSHNTEVVRWAAVDALGRVAKKDDPSALAVVIQNFEHPNEVVRSASAAVLPRIAQRGNKVAVSALEAQLLDQDAGARCAAVDALKELVEAPILLPVGVRLLQDQDARVRRAAVNAIMGTGHQVLQQVLLLILSCLRDTETSVVCAAIYASTRLASQNDAGLVTSELLPYLESPSAEVRRAATKALGIMVKSGAEQSVLDALAGRFQDNDGLVRYAAAQALRNCGRKDSPALPS